MAVLQGLELLFAGPGCGCGALPALLQGVLTACSAWPRARPGMSPSRTPQVISVQHTIDRREVEAKKALPKEESPVSRDQQAVASGQRTKKIFVGGLAATVDEEAFRAYFQEFGQVGTDGRCCHWWACLGCCCPLRLLLGAPGACCCLVGTVPQCSPQFPSLPSPILNLLPSFCPPCAFALPLPAGGGRGGDV